ncbi:MAG: SpoIID/LytB domain-containing protein [Clostridia bacterium]|nr:SpoIID/LytB domain-containing protein [Clostridia bacterium]
MKRFFRALCLLLCLTLLPLFAAAETAVTDDSPAPDVRVLLRRLNLTDRADLVLDGLYTAAVEGEVLMAFPQGAEVSVQVREGEIYLFYEGMRLRAGASLTFVRNDSGKDRTGLRFEKNGPLYPGTLALTVDSGVLRPILTINVEEYLLGVVPYEMSEYFPLEALKAQAVCARTYALNKLGSNRDYDVVDTTNDQVFKGVNYSYTNAIRAVEETAGVVGTYKGALATCYYSASNGGQTELVQHVWTGRGDWDYYRMTDDPYDVENPESVVRTAKIAKDGQVYTPFRQLLFDALAPEMALQGFLPAMEHLRIDGISAMSLGKPAFADPSRLYTELTVTFTWSGRRLILPATPTPAATPEEEFYFFATPTPTATPEPTPTPTVTVTPEPTPVLSDFTPASQTSTVTLRLFPDVLDALGLTINGSSHNELTTLTETDTHFILQARRYGHGVGMSQRGAQWMAGQYGKQFHEIMAFYYPGVTLMRIQSGKAVLPTPPPALAATLAPPATPTPRPTLMPVTTDELPEGAYVAAVMGIADDSSLNLRKEPSQASEILRRLYKYQQLIVLETCENPEWVKVKTDVIEGYVMVSFLEPVTDAEQPPVSATPAPTPTPSAALRKSP